MPRFQRCAVDWKPDGSEVTEGDRRAEAVMRELIARLLPAHKVLGEEYGGSQSPTDEPLWVLDPIDGTASFAVGLPMFGTLIGYVEKGEPQVGVIHLPAMGETVYAARGSGCWVKRRGCDPAQVHASAVTNLTEAYVSVSALTGSEIDPRRRQTPTHELRDLISKSRRFRFIEGPVQYALLAQGAIDMAMDAVMHPWDIAALVPCIEEAGGLVTDLEGHREGIIWRPNLVGSSTTDLHKQILSALRGVG